MKKNNFVKTDMPMEDVYEMNVSISIDKMFGGSTSDNMFMMVEEYPSFKKDASTNKFQSMLIKHLDNHIFSTNTGLAYKICVNSINLSGNVDELSDDLILTSIDLNLIDTDLLSYNLTKSVLKQFTADVVTRMVVAETIKFIDSKYMIDTDNLEIEVNFTSDVESDFSGVSVTRDSATISRILSDCPYTSYPEFDYNSILITLNAQSGSIYPTLAGWREILDEFIKDTKFAEKLKSQNFISFRSMFNAMSKKSKAFNYKDIETYKALKEYINDSMISSIEFRFNNTYTAEIVIPFKNEKLYNLCMNKPDVLVDLVVEFFRDTLYEFIVADSNLNGTNQLKLVDDFMYRYKYSYAMTDTKTDSISSISTRIDAKLRYYR